MKSIQKNKKYKLKPEDPDSISILDELKITEAAENIVVQFKTKLNIRNGGSLWFELPEDVDEKINDELNKIKDSTAQDILFSDEEEKYSSFIPLKIGSMIYGYYKSYGKGRIGAGGDFSKPNVRFSKKEIIDILKSTKFSKASKV